MSSAKGVSTPSETNGYVWEDADWRRCYDALKGDSLLNEDEDNKLHHQAWQALSSEVFSWPLHDRMGRVGRLILESHAILDWAEGREVAAKGLTLVGTVLLFSGGNDSTVMAHALRQRATHTGHANTGIGIEETRQFVRDTSAAWGLPLIERKAPNPDDDYKALVLDQGFPGPGHHYKMFQRLKDHALRQVRKELVANGRRERVMFLAGRRRQESKRRSDITELDRDGSTLWVSPMVNWTKADLATYRQMYDVPRNEVADICHMSGECLCGSFAHDGERAEIEPHYPAPFELIDWLEEQIKDRPDIPDHRKKWGWGGNKDVLKASRKQIKKAGYLCGACDSALGRLEEQLRLEDVA